MDCQYVGKPMARVDAKAKVTGQAVYSVDVDLPGMLYGAVLRSPLAHARILAMDVSQAKSLPGVRAVITAQDFPYSYGHMIKDQPVLAVGKVRFVGEPVAAVAAESELAAQMALDKIQVAYEELPAVFDPREALADGAPLIHENIESYNPPPPYKPVAGTNVCTVVTHKRGDSAEGFSQADQIFVDEFFVHPVSHTPLETHAAVVKYAPTEDAYTVWSATDAPYQKAKDAAKALGLSHNQVRFISTYSGGGFGGKGAIVAEILAMALARHTRGRPVKLVFSRQEALTASQTRVGAYIRLKTGVKKDGTLWARQADMLWDNGAYSSKAPEVVRRGLITALGPYRTPHISLRSRLVYTNKQPSGAYRGFGVTQVTWACETQMDMIAHRLGLDPLKLRLQNLYQPGDCFINGQVLDVAGLRETLEAAAEEIGWDKRVSQRQGDKVRGKGLAVTIKGTNTPTESCCFLKVNPDGSVSVINSTVEIGAGQKTVFAQIAADTLGVPLESISIPHPDSAVSPYDFGVTSSRTTFHMGNAVRLAAEKAREKILAVAGRVLQADPAKLSLIQGRIVEQGAGERMGLKELLFKEFGGKGGGILTESRFSSADSATIEADADAQWMSSVFWMWATHAVEVEVDVATGAVRVIKLAAAHDVGRAINPLNCQQQIEGSAVMGISNALFEEFRFQKGRIANDTLADYKIAGMLDLPAIVPILIESNHPEGPFGAKGVGEPAAAPTAPAIGNAIFNAVGVRFLDLPITRERMLAALKEKEKEAAAG